MIEQVRKRDGSVVPFEREKIASAIGRALGEVGRGDADLAAQLAARVEQMLSGRFGPLFGPPHVEEIQDAVEEVLMAAGLPDAARAYIVYRHQHKQLREIKELVDPELVGSYLNGQDWRVRENSNMAFSLQGLNVFLTEKIIGQYWLTKVYPEPIRRAHVEGDFHIHDLGTLGPYCVGWDLADLLRLGFRGARGKVESRPPKHFRVALMQAVNFLYTLQGEAAGAQAFSGVDTLLAPFIAADGLSYLEVKQA
ncbi:MAG TPA: anaerobic ribonucleoside-triphosphate reductase, partial [Candidatus Bipolaricaulis anaerobius]|nr:anaerobic ribonucleoside-triphosphate reductase [Candidatus Bipolaricaulis anaerobius]